MTDDHRSPTRLVRGTAGFTLLSLLVALIFIGISATFLLPAFLENTHRAKVQTAARQTATQMQLARYRAIREGREFGVFADFAGNRVALFDGTTPAGDEVGGFPLPGGITFQHPADGAAEGVNAITGFFENAAGGWVVFQPDGTADVADEGVDVAMNFAMAERGQYFQVLMPIPATANVRVRHWDGSAFVE